MIMEFAEIDQPAPERGQRFLPYLLNSGEKSWDEAGQSSPYLADLNLSAQNQKTDLHTWVSRSVAFICAILVADSW
jgi:hypothetical protein